MPKSISTASLLQQLSQRLNLQQCKAVVDDEVDFPYTTSAITAGLFNPNYPHPIQILDAQQEFQLAALPVSTIALILSDNQRLDQGQLLKLPCACFSSPQSTQALIRQITQQIHRLCAPRLYQHGNYVSVYGRGILILGEPGSGKSSLSLELLQRGHGLIADDAVYFYDDGEQFIGHGTGQRPPSQMHLRTLGFLNLAEHVADWQRLAAQRLDAVVRIAQHRRPVDQASLQANAEKQHQLGAYYYPLLELSAEENRASLLVETFARQQHTPANREVLETFSTLSAPVQQESAGL